MSKSFVLIRSVFRHHGDKISTGVGKRLLVSNINNVTFDKTSYKVDISKRGLPSYMFSRTMSSKGSVNIMFCSI